MTPHRNHTTGDTPYIGVDDRAMFAGLGSNDPGEIDEELADPFLTMVETMLPARETAQTKLQTLVDNRLSKYGQSDPSDHLPVHGRFRKHPGDRERANAVKVNEDRAKTLALVHRDLCKLAMYTHYTATEVHRQMEEQNRRYPRDTQAYGRLLTQYSGLQIAKAVREIMTMFPDMSFAGIAQTTNNPKR